jgi:hypothetical protein
MTKEDGVCAKFQVELEVKPTLQATTQEKVVFLVDIHKFFYQVVC